MKIAQGNSYGKFHVKKLSMDSPFIMGEQQMSNFDLVELCFLLSLPGVLASTLVLGKRRDYVSSCSLVVNKIENNIIIKKCIYIYISYISYDKKYESDVNNPMRLKLKTKPAKTKRPMQRGRCSHSSQGLKNK
jgi:hypothetical protein